MKKTKLLTLAFVLLALCHSAARAQQPSQPSLVKAWEEVQRNDPETVIFEKSGEGRYKFKTNRFPFDGELRLLKANIDDAGGEYETGWAVGVIEYDLVGLPEEVSKKYEHSIQVWGQNNRLYFDKESGAWLSLDKYRAKLAASVKEKTSAYEQEERSKKATGLWLNLAMWWGPVALLLVFWAWVLKITGIRRQREYRNMGVAHMQRVEELLERIACAAEDKAGAGRARETSRYDAQPPA